MKYFRDVVGELELMELGATGPRFTWLNKRRGEAKIQEKLDHFLASQGWLDEYPNYLAQSLELYG